MQISALFKEFINSEKSGGIILVVCAIISIAISNTFLYTQYSSLWSSYIFGLSVEHWINDGLMAVFFLLIGLELEREIYKGELSDIKNAALPISAALGGMIVPALIFAIFNFGLPTQSGFGIPMATDIAFSLAVLALLGTKIPISYKIFLTALAVIDDLGAILMIAFFYTKELSFVNLFISLGIFGILLLLNRLKVNKLSVYLILGAGMWYFMLNSGVHATITGVLLAFAIPFGDGGEKSISYKLQHRLHYPVAFFILPLFALANTAINIKGDIVESLVSASSLGIIFGLTIGKPIGIVLFSYLSAKLKISKLPSDFNFNSLLGIGFLAGIGFTMSIFITLLAFTNNDLINSSKISILFASLLAGAIGYFWLKYQSSKR